MENGIRIPAGLKKIFHAINEMDAESQEEIIRSARIFVSGRISGRKADYAAGYNAGYAKATAEAKTVLA